jgi:hypothetical protein
MSTIGSDPRNSWRPQKDVPNGVVIKIVRGHQIRRFTLEPSSSFAQLERQITARFGLTGRFRLRYEDDESEMCTVGCDSELLEAMRLAALTTPPVLRVQVEDEGTPSVATAEPASATKTDDVHVVVQRTPHTCHAYAIEPPLATKTDSVASLPNHGQADGTDLLREHEVTSSSIHTIRSHFVFPGGNAARACRWLRWISAIERAIAILAQMGMLWWRELSPVLTGGFVRCATTSCRRKLPRRNFPHRNVRAAVLFGAERSERKFPNGRFVVVLPQDSQEAEDWSGS